MTVTEFLAITTEVFTASVSWMTSILSFVEVSPLIYVRWILGFALFGIVMLKKLRG